MGRNWVFYWFFWGLDLYWLPECKLLIAYQLVPAGLPPDKMADAMVNAMLQPENVGAARLSQVLGTFFHLVFTCSFIYACLPR